MLNKHHGPCSKTSINPSSWPQTWVLITSLILVFWIGGACREGGGVIKSLVLLTGDGGGD